jgi:hypothetical protein
MVLLKILKFGKDKVMKYTLTIEKSSEQIKALIELIKTFDEITLEVSEGFEDIEQLE